LPGSIFRCLRCASSFAARITLRSLILILLAMVRLDGHAAPPCRALKCWPISKATMKATGVSSASAFTWFSQTNNLRVSRRRLVREALAVGILMQPRR
jgi:hypothetical protein